MGCVAGKAAHAGRAHRARDDDACLLETESDVEQQMPTLLTARASGLLKKGGSNLVQGGTSLVQKGSSSILKGSAAVVASGSSALGKVDPRRVHGEKEAHVGYLSVDVDVDEPRLTPAGVGQASERREWKLCANIGLVLLWIAILSGAVLLFHIGILPTVLGTTCAEVLLVVLASPILVPCVAKLLPFCQRRLAEVWGTRCYMWLCFAALWGALLALFVLLWDLGVMQVVVGVIFSQVVMVVMCLLLVIPCLAYALPMLKEAIFSIPGYVKRKLWEIPPLILPLFETMIKGLLHEMEQRILEKLIDLPKDVTRAVTQVGGNVKDLGKKGFSRARSVASKRSFSRRSLSDGNLDSGAESA